MFRLALSVSGAPAETLQAVSHRLFPGVLPDFFTVAWEIQQQLGHSPASAHARQVTWSYWREDASLAAPCPRPDDLQVFSWHEGDLRFRVRRAYKRVDGRWCWVDGGVRVGCRPAPVPSGLPITAGRVAAEGTRADTDAGGPI